MLAPCPSEIPAPWRALTGGDDGIMNRLPPTVMPEEICKLQNAFLLGRLGMNGNQVQATKPALDGRYLTRALAYPHKGLIRAVGINPNLGEATGNLMGLAVDPLMAHKRVV